VFGNIEKSNFILGGIPVGSICFDKAKAFAIAF